MICQCLTSPHPRFNSEIVLSYANAPPCFISLPLSLSHTHTHSLSLSLSPTLYVSIAKPIDLPTPPVAIKNQLDEGCASFITDVLAVKRIFLSNNKLYIMTFACAVALVAQFFPLE